MSRNHIHNASSILCRSPLRGLLPADESSSKHFVSRNMYFTYRCANGEQPTLPLIRDAMHASEWALNTVIAERSVRRRNRKAKGSAASDRAPRFKSPCRVCIIHGVGNFVSVAFGGRYIALNPQTAIYLCALRQRYIYFLRNENLIVIIWNRFSESYITILNYFCLYEQ